MRRQLAIFTILSAIFNSCRGMGTIDREPIKYFHPYKYEGRPPQTFVTMGTRTAGPAPIPIKQFNQRQKRKRARQMA